MTFEGLQLGVNSDSVVQSRGRFHRSIVRAARPKQWLKNLLIFAAPVAAGSWRDRESFFPILLAFVGFCAISSFGYVVNDWLDRSYDSVHPTKKNRPFASGSLGLPVLISLLFFFGLSYLAVASLLPVGYFYLTVAYLFVTLSYSLWVKRIPVVEMIFLSLGFLLRPLSGAAAISIPVSEWFLIVTSFGALFLIATKRIAEFRRVESDVIRPVVRQYSESFLTTVISVSIGVALTGYSFWAFSIYPNSPWPKISVLAVVLGMLRYAWHFERGEAESPDVIIWKDPVVLLCGLSSLILIVMAVQFDG
jgi:decaprenyl-phosphate phosphoribosyltransferase